MKTIKRDRQCILLVLEQLSLFLTLMLLTAYVNANARNSSGLCSMVCTLFARYADADWVAERQCLNVRNSINECRRLPMMVPTFYFAGLAA
ncbi:hypothetical protein O9992_28215 [Vibrio lentus]|nr:hypothetical protein [Vibrio lentus]